MNKSVFVVFLLVSFGAIPFAGAQSYVAVTNKQWYDPALYSDDPEDPDSKLNCGAQVKPFPVDWDEDGDIDILVGNAAGTICYFQNNGDDTFEKHENFGGFADRFLTPYAVDWDGDGEQDIIMGMANRDVNFYKNTGSTGIDGGNSFADAVSLIDLGVDTEGLQPALVDWDADGHYDIIIGTHSGNLIYLQNDGSNTFTETDSQWQDIDFGTGISPSVVDFDEDGDLDVVVGSGSEINLILNSGDHVTFSVTEEYIQASDTMLVGDSPRFIDWDGDTHSDIIMGSSIGYIMLYLNDYDEDGYVGEDDCDNEDAAVNVPTSYYLDADSDGFGDPNSESSACSQPTGSVVNNTDCNDTTNTANPSADEICDNLDNDCDGTVDESDATDAVTYYVDSDGDGLGNPEISIITCQAPETGFVTDNTDCNDTSATASTDAEEVCDGIDNNCNGEIDESSATDAVTYYVDSDGDGFGNAQGALTTCQAPASGFVTDNTDCDDTNADLTTECPQSAGNDDDDDAPSSGGCTLQTKSHPSPNHFVNLTLSLALVVFRILVEVRKRRF